MKTKLAILVVLVASIGAAHAASYTCKQSAFIFGKLTAATTNCNFPYTRGLDFFLQAAERFCGRGSKLPGSTAGGLAFYSDVKRHGLTAVCNRIGAELKVR